MKNFITPCFKFSICILLFFSFFSKKSVAQNSLKIGEWKSYQSYQSAQNVAQSSNKIFYATAFSLLMYDKSNNEIEAMSKVEGLSDAGIQLIKYSKSTDDLIVVYQNSNIDILRKDGTVENIRDIVDNLNIIGDKKVYDIFIADDGYAFFACGFGFLKFNLTRGEFEFTTFTNRKINCVTIYNSKIHIGTNDGIYAVSNDNKTNLADFKNWQLLGVADGLPKNKYACKAICSANNKIYVGINDSLCVLENKILKKLVGIGSNHEVNFINKEGKNILFNFIQKNDNKWDSKFGYLNDKEEITLMQPNECVVHIFDALEDEKGNIWLADVLEGFKRLENINGSTALCKSFTYNSPYAAPTSEVAIDDDNSLWATSGTIFNGVYRYNFNGFYRFADNKWTYKNSSNDPTMKSGYKRGAKVGQGEIRDCNTVVINKKTKKAYIGSYWAGIVEADPTGKITNYFNETNSTLGVAEGDTNSVRVGGLAFDKKGNLWVANTLSKKPISVFTADGKWHSMGSKIGPKFIFQCVVDPINSYKWFANNVGEGGILVYDEGKDIVSEADDRYTIINTSNSNLTSNKVNCLATDLSGRVWVGTDDGALYFSCGSSLFDGKNSCKGYSPRTILDNIPELLLRYNNVTCIAVDGADRKYFGTSKGFFIQSPDGTEQIAYYNTENSPLFDDVINHIAINNKTGEVYISTNRGIQSFKTDALVGGTTQNEVLAYPNPIRPDYEGPIAIKGLAQDSKVKITDLNGRLVYETEALGGQAIWDGKDYNGRKVETGVYFIFATYIKNLDYPDSAVGKLLMVK
jgi:ligand-binding sensor domain-containing protein